MIFDKRRFIRYPCRLGASYRGTAGLAISETTVENISEGGIFFKTDRHLPLVEVILIYIEQPNEEPIVAPVRPVWVKELSMGRYAVGARFVNPSPEDVQSLRSLIADLQPA